MIDRDFYLIQSREMEQICRIARIDEDLVDVKTVNAYIKFVIVWCDDPCRVDRWKGYWVVHQKHCRDNSQIADSVYSGPNRGCLEYSSPLFLGLILAVGRSPQYEVDGRPGLWNMSYFCNGPVNCGSNRCPSGWLPQISSKVAGSNQSFHQIFKALALIGLVAMVPVIITPQRSVALVRSSPHWRGPLDAGEIADEGQEPIIGNVESSEMGESFFFSKCPSRSFWLLP